ncbi:MAG TPA: prepilin-type N-terminal cleavage/methylation domain-containing protein [Tepidisphaeraceae bacterium]|nr:prepilin-type N-terminal cleavage/methylation domain-containing protein [Tepidisphaeraceae bacterium]
MRRNSRKTRGFSLIELVIVVVIIGIIAAIAIPRMSRGSQGASDHALSGDMAVWRSALDLYQTEHNGAYPKDYTTIVNQLTQYTDDQGTTSPTKDTTHIYGPYLRAVPPMPVSDPTGTTTLPKGSTTVGPTASGGAPSSLVSGGYGWVYDGAGNLYPNTGTVTDATGKLYNAY